MKKTITKIKRGALTIAFALAFLNFGCEPASLKKQNPSANSAANAVSSKESDAATFVNDLQTMRNADFDFVYVFRRKDGGTLDGEDKKYLRANSPAATNRFILTDQNRAAIAGSSFKFEPGNLDSLRARFAVEDFSKPENERVVPAEKGNAPTNSNKQGNSNR